MIGVVSQEFSVKQFDGKAKDLASRSGQGIGGGKRFGGLKKSRLELWGIVCFIGLKNAHHTFYSVFY